MDKEDKKRFGFLPNKSNGIVYFIQLCRCDLIKTRIWYIRRVLCHELYMICPLSNKQLVKLHQDNDYKEKRDCFIAGQFKYSRLGIFLLSETNL